jgi:4-amino-4-deoxy-L-arabinose transferase-like glycosyltransferase
VLTGPLTFWIEAVLARLSGLNLPAMRLPLLFNTAFLTWAVYWLTSRCSSAVYSAGTALAFMVYESRIRLLSVNHRWDSGALGTAAVMAALAAQRPGRRGLWALSGALCAAAAWATPSFAIIAVPLLWWSTRQSARSAFAFFGGAALITSAAALYLQSHGALLAMFQALRWTGANYTAANRVPYGSVWAGAGMDVGVWQYLAVAVMEIVRYSTDRGTGRVGVALALEERARGGHRNVPAGGSAGGHDVGGVATLVI